MNLQLWLSWADWAKSGPLRLCSASRRTVRWKVLRQTLCKSVFGLLKILVMPSLRLLANGFVGQWLSRPLQKKKFNWKATGRSLLSLTVKLSEEILN